MLSAKLLILMENSIHRGYPILISGIAAVPNISTETQLTRNLSSKTGNKHIQRMSGMVKGWDTAPRKVASPS